MKMSQEQMGVRRTALTLLRVNQPTGFDCPGCAWPDPGHTHTAEFCENGAKAVAEEATLRRVDRDFFARHGLDDLAGRTDYWLGQQGRLTEPMYKPAGGDHYEPIDWDGRLRPDRRAAARRCRPRTPRRSTPRAAPPTRPRSSTS